MKHNLNVIHINGIRGLIITAGIVCCLFAGFVIFPGIVAMFIWNKLAGLSLAVPSIGIVQGVLLWCIIISAYLIIKKDRVIVCVKSPKGLSEEELRAVFADLKEHANDELMRKTMISSQEKETELKQEISETENKEETTEKSI